VQPNPDNIVIVLSHTTEPGNVGAACRAMKTMGLRRLRLIAPINPKGRTARALAHGAEDVLAAATVVDNLDDAVGDALLVCGTTARRRQMRKDALMAPAELAEKIVSHSGEGPVAVMFGTERAGLTNDEIDICRFLSAVPAAAEQTSLNLAMAVMLYAWEIRQAFGRAAAATTDGPDDPDDPGGARPGPSPRRPNRPPEMAVGHPHRATRLPTQFELDTMYGHLAYAMESLGYTEFERRKFLTFLRQLHMRAGIVDWELQIYHLLARRILEKSEMPKFMGQ
jgi:TrmH family RNA methyltransferase